MTRLPSTLSPVLGPVLLTVENGRAIVSRDVGRAAWWARPLAAWLASREARVLRRLEGIPAVPALLHWNGDQLIRAYLFGHSMDSAPPHDPAYYRRALRLLRQIHRRGVAHNDLAKEPNWLVLPNGEPAVIDFQLAWCDPSRGRLFRLMAREDLRHLLKHKRTHCPTRLTGRQRRLLAQPALPARLWAWLYRPVGRAIGMRLGTSRRSPNADRPR